MRRIFIIIVFLAACHGLSAQRVGVAFWNVENLFDTIPSPFYDDAEFTPREEYKWGTERYGTKIKNLARVLDGMAADIVGLAEVENEAVVRDLVVALGTDYNYIHRTSNDSRGIDLALLYKGDKFFPDPDGIRLVRAGTYREFLHVSGELLGERVEIVVCHMASNLNSNYSRLQHMGRLRSLLERLLKDNPAANVIVMGDMNATPGDKVVRKTIGSVESPYDFVYTPHWNDHKAGRGSYSYRGRWYLYDWIMVSPSLARGSGSPGTPGSGMRVGEAGIYAKEWMTGPATSAVRGARKPLRSFYGGDYLGGYSDHFPVYIVIWKSR